MSRDESNGELGRSLLSWRVRQHLLLAGVGTLVAVVVAVALPKGSLAGRISIGTAHASLLLLALTLLLGPLHVVTRGRPHPLSTHRRRDVGIWAAIFGLVHTLVGLNVHMGGQPWKYFVEKAGDPAGWRVRFDAFGLANHVGLAATLLLVLLLAISSDRALSRLGPSRWKLLQRSTYVLAVAVVAHGAAYQIIEKRVTALVALLVVAAVAIAAGQLLGWRRLTGERKTART